MSSVHDKLSRVRKPRVHIEYKVEIGNANREEASSISCRVSSGDFAGNNPKNALKPLRDRKFANIDRDNINEVMKSITPGITTEVENTLAGDGSMMTVNLNFKSMEDFSPAKVAEQIPALKKLMDTRNQLKDLRSKMDVSTDLEATLEQVLKNSENVASLASELGLKKDDAE